MNEKILECDENSKQTNILKLVFLELLQFSIILKLGMQMVIYEFNFANTFIMCYILYENQFASNPGWTFVVGFFCECFFVFYFFWWFFCGFFLFGFLVFLTN